MPLQCSTLEWFTIMARYQLCSLLGGYRHGLLQQRFTPSQCFFPLKNKTACETKFWLLLEVSSRAKKWFHVHFFPCFSLSRPRIFHGHIFQFFSRVRNILFQGRKFEFDNKAIIWGYKIVLVWKTGKFWFSPVILRVFLTLSTGISFSWPLFLNFFPGLIFFTGKTKIKVVAVNSIAVAGFGRWLLFILSRSLKSATKICRTRRLRLPVTFSVCRGKGV